MKEDRRDKLESIGIVWKVDTGNSEKSLKQRHWDAMFDLLVAFKREHGHCRVPFYESSGGRHWRGHDSRLGTWVKRQRETRQRINPHRIERLNKLGFQWDGFYEDLWNDWLEKLKQYKREYGDCIVPRNYIGIPGLSDWVATQKARKRTGKFASHREAKLSAVGFAWNWSSSQGKAASSRILDRNPSHIDTMFWQQYDKRYRKTGKRKRADEEEESEEEFEWNDDNVDDSGKPKTRKRKKRAEAADDEQDRNEETEGTRDESLDESGWFDKSDSRTPNSDGKCGRFPTNRRYNVGTLVRKHFPDHGWCIGEIVSNSSCYQIIYEDNDEEEFSLGDAEVDKIVEAACDLSTDDVL